MSLTTEETAGRNHQEGLTANEAAQANKRVLTGQPQGTPEIDFQVYHSGLPDDDAREECEYQIAGSIIGLDCQDVGDHVIEVIEVIEAGSTGGVVAGDGTRAS